MSAEASLLMATRSTYLWLLKTFYIIFLYSMHQLSLCGCWFPWECPLFLLTTPTSHSNSSIVAVGPCLVHWSPPFLEQCPFPKSGSVFLEYSWLCSLDFQSSLCIGQPVWTQLLPISACSFFLAVSSILILVPFSASLHIVLASGIGNLAPSQCL